MMSRQCSPMARLGVLLLFVVLCASSTQALSESFGESDAQALKKLYAAEARGSFDSLEKAYFAVKTFERLGSLASIPADKACAYAAEKLTPAVASSDLVSVHRAQAVLEALSCKQAATLPSKLVSTLAGVIEGAESSSVTNLHHAAATLALLKSKSRLADDTVPASAIAAAVSRVKALKDDDGSIQNDKQSTGSTTVAGIAYQLLADLVTLAGGWDKLAQAPKDQITSIAASAKSLFDLAEEDEDGLVEFVGDEEDGDAASLIASAAILRGADALSAATGSPLAVDESKVFGLAALFLANKAVSEQVEAFYVADALSLLASNRLAVPLVLSLTRGSISVNAKVAQNLKVLVTDVMGKAVPSLRLTLVTAVKDKKEVLSNVPLEFADGGYKLDLMKVKPDIGAYKLTLQLTPEGAAAASRYTAGKSNPSLELQVTGTVGVSDVVIGVVDNKAVIATTSLSGGSLPSGLHRIKVYKSLETSLKASHLQTLAVKFSLRSQASETVFAPQQCFIELVPKTGGDPFVFLAAPDAKGDFSLSLDFLEAMEAMRYLSGTYSVELLVGDRFMENSFQWKLGMLELTLPEPPAGTPSPKAAKERMARYKPKPEIDHMHRAPEARPASAVSLAFVGLIGAAFAGLLLVLFKLNVNVQGALKGPGATFAVVFHLALLCMLVVLVAFFVKLNIFQALKLLFPLGGLALVSGYKTLSDLANSKVKTA
eukprot:jgi/Mesvir1/11723/Mv00104-RA.1